ncbi:MAG: hypothetical protein J6O17_10050 [Eubacterium sp.]|nr:hypothetical protein [Eubacterium sp.]
MKRIEPFNDIWLDCYNNQKLSILIYKNEDNKALAYNNNYKYEIMPYIFGGSKEFNCIACGQYIITFEEFSQMDKMNPKNEEEFLKLIKNQVTKENGFVLMRTDLYDWLEDSICWHRYHWDHYSLIVDYDEENQQFLVFDEKKGNYVKFYVPESKIYKCVFHTDKFEILRLITLDGEEIKIQTTEDIKKNASDIVESIDNCLEKRFWDMEEFIFDGEHYKDLNGIFLQKIEGRHKANAGLIRWMETNGMASGLDYRTLSEEFEKLSVEWAKIRMALFVIYMKKKNRQEKINELNEKLYECLTKERELWNQVIAS